MIIWLDHVSKSFNHTSVIENLSITFPEDQTTIIIGPSGCGKSTLLRLILGLVLPSSGKIYLDHQEIISRNANDWRRRIGYVTQDGGLFPHLTAYQNITLMAQYLNYDKHWIKLRIEELSDLVRLQIQKLGLYPTELSGGQRQRISLMRALFLNPSCLLLDEPLGALDPMTRHELQVELKQVFLKLQKTILLVTHDMREAAYFGNEIILMHLGKIIQQGSFLDLLQHPKDPFVSEFIKIQEFPKFNCQEMP